LTLLLLLQVHLLCLQLMLMLCLLCSKPTLLLELNTTVAIVRRRWLNVALPWRWKSVA